MKGGSCCPILKYVLQKERKEGKWIENTALRTWI